MSLNKLTCGSTGPIQSNHRLDSNIGAMQSGHNKHIFLTNGYRLRDPNPKAANQTLCNQIRPVDP
jgi:hypothetical protein